MSRKKETYKPLPWESGSLPGKDTSANLYHSMLYSPAFCDLSAEAVKMYLFMKDRRFAVREDDHPLFMKGHPRPDTFTFNYALYKKLWSKPTFSRYRDELILHGFIRIAADRNGGKYDGRSSRTETIYCFSDKWRLWGTTDFKIDRADMPESLYKKLQEGKIDRAGHPLSGSWGERKRNGENPLRGSL